jgi:hypothetical protein
MDENDKFTENRERLKNHLIKMYYRNKFEYRDDEHKILDLTMQEIAEMIELMVKQIYEIGKNNE